MSRAFLGIDLGTSGVKAALYTEDGRLLATASREYQVETPAPGAAEGDPGAWWKATCGAVCEAVSRAREDSPVGSEFSVGAVGVDGQMHGIVLADKDLRPVRPAVTWADTRARRHLARWHGLAADEVAALANPLVPGMTGPLYAWLAATEPASVAAARWVLLPKDWLRGCLTGVAATEPSDASATLLWDVPADTWSAPALAAAGLPPAMLPPLLGSGDRAGRLTAASAEALGLPAGVPVAAGASDTAAALLGSGLQTGQTLLTVGSGAQILQLRTQVGPVRSPPTHLYRAAAAQQWYAMAAVQNVGLALGWVRRALAATWAEVYDSLDVDARSPVFVPYLTGERTPIVDDAAGGAWVGLSISHDRTALLRSAVIGVVCAIRNAFDVLTADDPERPQVVFVAGGGTRDPRLCQLLADMLETPLQPVNTTDSSVLGAASLGAQAAGFDLPRPHPRVTSPIGPGVGTPERQEQMAGYLDAIRLLSRRLPGGL
ncbi:MAG: FGGY family carbohydrate kinase [Actinomycetota bacterium]